MDSILASAWSKTPYMLNNLGWVNWNFGSKLANLANTIPRDWSYSTHHKYHLVGLMPTIGLRMKYSSRTLKTGIWWQPERLILEEPGLAL
jgi:hypothetical protein